MGLRAKTFLIVVLSIAVLIATLLGVSHTLLMGEFRALERREASLNLERIENSFKEQIRFIETKISDWSNWDDTYKFVQDRNDEFKQSNLQPDTLNNLKLDFMVFFDKDGQLITQLIKAPEESAGIDLAAELATFLPSNLPMTKHASETSSVSGLFTFASGGPFIAVSRPVLTSSITGPPMGSIIFGRRVDETLITTIAENTRMPVQRVETPIDVANVSLIPGSSPNHKMIEAGENLLRGFVDVMRNDGNVGLVLEAEIPRTIMQQGRSTIRTVLVAILMASLIFGAITLWMLERVVIARLTRLGRTAEKIGSEKDVVTRLIDDGSDELRELSDTLNRMLDTIADRNRAMRDIVDNVTFGFLICNRKMIIAEGYTKSCAKLFNTDDIRGRSLTDVLGMKREAAEWFGILYDQIFEDFMPESVTAGQMPARFSVGSRTIRCEPKALRDDRGRVTAVMFSIVDITELEQVERQNRENRTLLKILRSPQAFVNFVADVRSMTSEIRTAVASGNEVAVRQKLHTLKGNFGCFDLIEIASTIHAVEDKPRIDKSSADRIETMMKDFLERNRDVLRISYDHPTESAYSVSESEFGAIELFLAIGSDSDKLRARIRDAFQTLRKRPVRELLGPMTDLVNEVAFKLGKSVRFEIVGDDTKVASERIEPVIGVLPHLLKNAIDHGIERGSDRGIKSALARITLTFTRSSTGINIVVEDDGRGIDTAKITAKALAQGLVTKAEADRMIDAEKQTLIFRGTVSTADKVTDISGRGVGVSAVVETVNRLGGTIRVASKLHEGCRFEIEIPDRPEAPQMKSGSPSLKAV